MSFSLSIVIQSISEQDLLRRCTDIVGHCIVQGVSFNSEQCCSDILNNKPIFTSKGVCYGSKIQQVARYPSDLEAVEIWLTPRRPNIEYAGIYI